MLWGNKGGVAFACVVDGPKELAMAQEVIWEKPRWNGEFWLNIISLRKILWWSSGISMFSIDSHFPHFDSIQCFKFYFSLSFLSQFSLLLLGRCVWMCVLDSSYSWCNRLPGLWLFSEVKISLCWRRLKRS